jgi:hypothetical protein
MDAAYSDIDRYSIFFYIVGFHTQDVNIGVSGHFVVFHIFEILGNGFSVLNCGSYVCVCTV